MYTQCPECETTFRLGAADLRRAQGKVRCGDCNHVFNALEYLAEDIEEENTAAVADEMAAGGWTSSTRNPDGELAPDLDEYEATAFLDETADSEVPNDNDPNDDDPDDNDPDDNDPDDNDPDDDDPDDDDPDDDGAILYIGEDEPQRDSHAAAPEVDTDTDASAADTYSEEAEVEFDDSLWERVAGVTTEPDFEPGADFADESGEETGDETADEDDDVREHSASEDPEIDLADSTEGEGEGEGDDDGLDADDSSVIIGEDDAADTDADDLAAKEPVIGNDEDDLEFNVPQDSWGNFFGPLPKGQTAAVWKPPHLDEGDEAEGNAVEGEQAWDELTASADDAADSPDVDADDNAATDSEETEPSWRGAEAGSSRGWLFLLGGVLLAVALTAQLLHYNRDRLAASPSWGEDVRALYATLGSTLYPDWSVGDYEIRGSEAVAGETGRDVLDIRAQIANTGELPVGLPRLRVVLRDRWSNPVAAQDFGAAEYTRDLPADALLQPGDMVSAHVSIQDPGSGAQGFELELCLPRRHTGLECSGQPFK